MQKSLFGDDLSHEAYVEQKLRPYFPALWKSCVDPFNDLLRRRQEDHAFSHMVGVHSAHWMNPQSTELATRLFSQHHPEVRIQDAKYGTDRMFALFVDDEISISFKKLRGRLVRSNYPTKHNRSYWKQSLFPKEFSHVIFGYKLVRSETDIRLYLTYPTDDESNGWVIPITDQSDAASKLDLESIDTSQGREEERKRRVQPRRKPAAGEEEAAG